MGLVVSNGIIALSGALMAQQEGYADASRGLGSSLLVWLA